MHHLTVVLSVALWVCGGVACSAARADDTPTPPPPQAEADTSEAEKPTDTPATPTTTSRVDPAVDALLDRIEAAAAQLKTLRADLRYDRVQGLLGDEQRRFGQFRYEAGPPARFDARFDRLLVDGAARRIELRYTFDGIWLAERDGQGRTFTRRQLVEEESRDTPMQLGQSPFVLPLDAKKADILARFDVALAEPTDTDPADTHHLVLTPRPGIRMDQQRIDLWYDRDTLLPRRVATHDDSQNTSVIDLMRVQVNVNLPDRDFDTTPPRGGNWDVQVVPLDD